MKSKSIWAQICGYLTTADIYDERLESGKKHYPVASNKEYGYGDLHDQRIGGYPSHTPNIDNFYREDELVNLYDSNDVKKLPLGQRQWTGVWAHRSGHSESSLPIPPLPRNLDIAITFNKSWMPDSEYDHHPAIEKAWLVSGNEGWQRKLAIWKKGRTIDFIEVPDGLPRDDGGKRYLNDPEGETYGNYENAWMDHLDVVRELNASSNYHHPLLALPYYFENSGQSAWLLKNPVLSQAYDPNNSVHVKNWKDYLVAEPVKVPKTALHLHQDQRDDDPLQDWQTRFGGYAYWVGDEGVKAKLGVFSSPPRCGK